MVVVDDDTEVADLLTLMFRLDERFELVGSAATAHEGLSVVRDVVPDVAVIDLDLPDVTGLVLLEQITSLALDVRVVVFSAFPDPFTLLDVLKRGADGYVDKATAWSELLPTVAGLFHGTALSA